MKLREVLNTLASGELSNLSFVDETTGTIKTEAIGKLISSINMGMTDLHTRFLLKLGSITVNLQKGQTIYPLKPEYQVGQRTLRGTTQFISADGTRLDNDLLKIQQVFAIYDNDRSGFNRDPVELGLNDHDARHGVFTTSYNTLNVPLHLQEEDKVKALRVVYRQNADPICQCDNDYDPDCIEVELDYSHLWALCLFVASRVHNPSGFGTGGVHEGNNYWSKYLAECARLDEANMRLDYVADNTKRLQKGFP